MYKFENGKFVLNVGVNISFAYSNMDKSNQYHNIFMPNVNFTMGLIKDYLWFYASAEGKNYLNDYYNSILKNKAILPYGNLKTSSIPFVIKGGFKGKGSDKFSYDINMGYQRNSGMIQFITDDSGKFFYPAYSSKIGRAHV